MRAYLTTMREQAFIDIKPGYSDTGASSNETKPIYSAYTPPSPKKKKKVVRTRFRETTHSFRQKSPQAASQDAQATAPPPQPQKKGKKNASGTETASMKPGKKEKIRFGKAPQETLPKAASSQTEDAGAMPQVAANTEPEPVNPLEPAKPEKKTRFSERAKEPKQPKAKSLLQKDALAPAAPDAAEVADRQTQAAPLGLAGDTATKKKKKSTTSGDKTRLSDKNKKPAEETQQPAPSETPSAPAPQAPAPAPQQ